MSADGIVDDMDDDDDCMYEYHPMRRTEELLHKLLWFLHIVFRSTASRFVLMGSSNNRIVIVNIAKSHPVTEPWTLAATLWTMGGLFLALVW